MENKKYQIFFSIFLVISIIFSMYFKIIDEVSVIDNVKYIFFLITIAIGCTYIYKMKKKLILKTECFYGMILIIIFLLLSIFISLYNNQPLHFRTFVELIYIFIPFMTAFLAINILTKDEIIKTMKILLFLCILLYLYELINKGINISNLLEISFKNSYSPLESYIFADFSLISFCFFCYFKNYSNNFILSNKLCYYISFLFSLLTFKRILVMFSIILFAIDKFNILEIKINKKLVFFIGVCIFIMTIIYTWLLSYDNSQLLINLFNFDLDKFTVGRKWYLSLIQNAGYLSAGYGSTTIALENILGVGRYLEMDLVKILLEISPIGLALFIYVYWYQIYNNLFSVLVMLFLFINMFFSHSLTTFYVWVVTLLMFYTIKKDCFFKSTEECKI